MWRVADDDDEAMVFVVNTNGDRVNVEWDKGTWRWFADNGWIESVGVVVVVVVFPAAAAAAAVVDNETWDDPSEPAPIDTLDGIVGVSLSTCKE